MSVCLKAWVISRSFWDMPSSLALTQVFRRLALLSLDLASCMHVCMHVPMQGTGACLQIPGHVLICPFLPQSICYFLLSNVSSSHFLNLSSFSLLSKLIQTSREMPPLTSQCAFRWFICLCSVVLCTHLPITRHLLWYLVTYWSIILSYPPLLIPWGQRPYLVSHYILGT